MNSIDVIKSHPIIFGCEMIRAILAGKKNQTRRIIKFPRSAYIPDINWIKSIHEDGGGNWIAWSTDTPDLQEFTKKAYPNGEGFPCPYGTIGDILWIRETFSFRSIDGKKIYKATDEKNFLSIKWIPSIFMPKWASRIVLLIVNIKPDRLQNISESDAQAEGVEFFGEIDYTLGHTYQFRFKQLWDSINKPEYSWKNNPWVWVIKFKQELFNIEQIYENI